MEFIQTVAEILLVFACFCAIFSEKIEQRAKSNGKIKHIILGFSAAVSIVSIVALVMIAYL